MSNAQAIQTLAVKRACTKFLSHHQPLSGSAWLGLLAQAEDLDVDFYGEGEVLGAFERALADRLGKPAAAFFPSGVMAQQAALRTAADAAGLKTVALHPRCHVAAEEEGAFEQLHDLVPLALTDEARQPTAEDFQVLATRPGSLLIELPLRRLAFALAPWEELVRLANAARQAGVWVHLDGARLWECSVFYERPVVEIAALADSVYISLYKGLGGVAGAALAGPSEFVAQACLWRRRHGGLLRSVFPLVEAARRGMAVHVPRMSHYVVAARELARVLQAEAGVRTAPSEPQINAFQVHLPATARRMETAHLEFARATGLWLFDGFRPAGDQHCHADVTIGDGFDRWTNREVVEAVTALVAVASRDA